MSEQTPEPADRELLGHHRGIEIWRFPNGEVMCRNPLYAQVMQAMLAHGFAATSATSALIKDHGELLRQNWELLEKITDAAGAFAALAEDFRASGDLDESKAASGFANSCLAAIARASGGP